MTTSNGVTFAEEIQASNLSLPHSEDDNSSTITASADFATLRELHSQVELCSSGNNVHVDATPAKSGEKEYTGIKRYGGMILTVVTSICLSFVTLLVKSLQDYGVDAYGSSFWRYLGITLPAIPILAFYECRLGCRGAKNKGEKSGSVFNTVWPIFENQNWKTWIGLFARGITASTSVILRYYALKYLSIGDTSVITYSTPVLVTVMAHFFLGEKCGVIPVIITFTTLAGVMIVIKPPLLTGQEAFDTNTLIGTGLALGSLFFSSLIVIITRKIREVHFALMVLVFGTIGVAQSAILAFSFGHGHLDIPTQLYDSLLVGGVAVLSFVAQIAIILALKFEQAGPVSLLRSLDVIFGYILQFAFLGVIPDIYSSIGGVIVLCGVIIIASRKWIKTMPDDSAVKKCFGWVLL